MSKFDPLAKQPPMITEPIEFEEIVQEIESIGESVGVDVPQQPTFTMWRCQYCGYLNLPIPKCAMCRFRKGPDSVWRVIGKLGPRADGKTYYIFGNAVTGQVCYKWDVLFWRGTKTRHIFLNRAFSILDAAYIISLISPKGK